MMSDICPIVEVLTTVTFIQIWMINAIRFWMLLTTVVDVVKLLKEGSGWVLAILASAVELTEEDLE